MKYAPMLASTGPMPADIDRWAFEPKWDGMRGVIEVDPELRHGLRIWSRRGLAHTDEFPELVQMAAVLGRRVVLDGEIIICGSDGKPDFERLRHRLAAGARSMRRVMAEHPATFMAFDVLALDGKSLCPQSYTERRAALEFLELAGPSWQTTGSWVGQGLDLLRSTAELDLEGIIAKRLASSYRMGTRSKHWIKFKHKPDRVWLAKRAGARSRARVPIAVG